MSLIPKMQFSCWSYFNFGVVYGVCTSCVSFKQISHNIPSEVYQTPSRVHFTIEDASILNTDVDLPKSKWSIDILILAFSSTNIFIVLFENIGHASQFLFFFSTLTWNLLKLDAVHESLKSLSPQIYIPK